MKKNKLRIYPTGVYGNAYHEQTAEELYAQIILLNNLSIQKSKDPFHTDLISDLKENDTGRVVGYLKYIASQKEAKNIKFIFYLDFFQSLKSRMESLEYLRLVNEVLGELDVSLETSSINGHTEDLESFFKNFILPHSKYGFYTKLENVKIFHNTFFEKYAEKIV